jgi:hypothetical protein
MCVTFSIGHFGHWLETLALTLQHSHNHVIGKKNQQLKHVYYVIKVQEAYIHCI